MSTRSPETPNPEPPPPPNTVVPHVLCHCCSRIVKKSNIIQALAADRLHEYVDTIESNLKKEIFLHNPNPSYIFESSAAGCHLCSLAIPKDVDHSCGDSDYRPCVSVYIQGDDDDIKIYFKFGFLHIDIAEELLNDFDRMDSDAERIYMHEARRFLYPEIYVLEGLRNSR